MEVTDRGPGRATRRRLTHHIGAAPMWRHTLTGDTYVTVVIDLTPPGHRHGPSAGHGSRTLEASVHELAGRPSPPTPLLTLPPSDLAAQPLTSLPAR